MATVSLFTLPLTLLAEAQIHPRKLSLAGEQLSAVERVPLWPGFISCVFCSESFFGTVMNPLIFTWTPGANTPDVLYYHSPIHQKLGWRILGWSGARAGFVSRQSSFPFPFTQCRTL